MGKMTEAQRRCLSALAKYDERFLERMSRCSFHWLAFPWPEDATYRNDTVSVLEGRGLVYRIGKFPAERVYITPAGRKALEETE